MTTTESTETQLQPGAGPTEEISPLGRSLRVATGGRFGYVRDLARDILPASIMVRRADMSIEEARDWCRASLKVLTDSGLSTSGYPVAYGGLDDVGRSAVDFEMAAHGDLSTTVKSGVQFGLFGGAIVNLGTDFHHETYLADTMSMALPGCYAMTEIGHGSDVASLQTTLTYDPTHDELVVNSPTRLSQKAYIGGAGQDAQMAVVYGQLWVGEDCHGVHAAMVPIRDENGADLPGVTTGDHGAKGGLAGVDNGTLIFDHVRVPRQMLLNRYGGITKEGVYESEIENPNRRFFTMLGTLVRGRISIAAAGGAASRKALSIATRYATMRHQFEAPGHDPEVLLIDYLAHQRKLLPAISTAYALMFAQNELAERLSDLHQAPEKDQEAQRELETRAAGMKAMTTRFANDKIQMSREACGGAGYMAENGFTLLRRDADVFATFEGDNTVLMQLVAKGLLTNYKEMFGDLDARGMVQFVARSFGGAVIERTAARPVIHRLIDTASRRSEEDTLLDRGWHLAMFEDRERHVLETVAGRMRAASKAGKDSFDTFNDVQDHVLMAARTHMDRVILEAFVAGIDDCQDKEAAALLNGMCDLHCLTSLEGDSGWFQQHNRMSATRAKAITAQINELCKQLRPDAIPMVEGMGFPVEWLGSSMLTEDRWTR